MQKGNELEQRGNPGLRSASYMRSDKSTSLALSSII